MSREEAERSVGELVMSNDAGAKTIQKVSTRHGPYRLLRITKGGMAELDREKERMVPPSLLSLPDWDE